jgi:hypothetical protein
MKKSKCLVQVLSVATVTLLGVSAAKAALVNYNIVNSEADLETFNLEYNGPTSYPSGPVGTVTLNSALVGGIQISKVSGGAGLPSAYTTVCTDLGGSVYLGSTYGYDLDTFSGQTGIDPNWGLNAYDGSLTSGQLLIEQGKAIQNAAYLFYTYNSYLKSGTPAQMAALQLAVWQAVYDTTLSGSVASIGSTLSSSARFAVTGGDSSAISLANTMLATLNGTGSYGLTGDLLFPDPNTTQGNGDGNPVQELLMRTQDATPVPEPSAMLAGAVMLLPFGASTLRVLRKSRKL